MILHKKVTAIQVWTDLEILLKRQQRCKAIQLDNELRNIVIGNFSITDYCIRIKTIVNRLHNIDATVSERIWIIGLSSKFDHIVALIRHKSPLFTFLETRSMLLLEEQRWNQIQSRNVLYNPVL